MTKEGKHTPGEWHANVPAEEQHAEGSTIRESIHGDIVAVLHRPRAGSVIANGRLIAAAPELLEALRAVCDRSSDAGDDSCGWPMRKVRVALLDQARAAIRKATEPANG